MKYLVILQARMGSTRLPGKVMKQINGKPLIQCVYDRLKLSGNVDHFIVATTTNREDDDLCDFCEKEGINYYRGSDWDVLDRFYNAASSFQNIPNAIIRICCDNPLHSYKVLDFVISEYEKSDKDYFSNSNNEPDFLEDGFDVEVFSFKALEVAWKEARLLSEREHVCPYIKKNFKCGWKKAHDDYDYKLSVDTKEDFEMVTTIFEELKDKPDFSIEEVVNLLKEKPELLKINRNSKINAGYDKSIEDDKIVR